MKSIVIGAAALTVMTGVASAQTSTDLTANDLTRRVGILAADSMLGRDAGQIGNVRATSYVARELARLGLTEAGESGYFQTVPLVTRGPVQNATLSVGGVPVPAAEFQSVRPAGGAPFGGVFDKQNVPTIYGGTIGGEMVDPAQVRGKVVVFRMPAGNNNAYGGSSNVLLPYAAAAGVLITGMDRMTPQAVNSQKVSRFTLSDASLSLPSVPAAVIRSDGVGAQIFDSEIVLQPGVAGRPVSGRFGLEDSPTPHPSRNVVAIVRGTDAALRNEYIAIGAHTDHVGVGRPVDHDSVRAANQVLRPLGANAQPRHAGEPDMLRIRALRDSLAKIRPPRMDSIFNGADDDASGTAVALELAEYFAKHPPRRSLLFVFHTAEEKGLFGALHYTSHPTVKREMIVANLNMDQVSRGGPSDVAGSEPNTVYLLGTRRLSTQLGDLVETINAKPEHNLRLDYSLDEPGHPANGYCRSDHYAYARFGIPVVFLSAGWHRDYHMVTDEAAYVQPETMLRIGSFARDIVAAVADAKERPDVDQPKPDPNGVCRQ